MPLHASSTCAHRQEAKIVLYSLRYHYTYRWQSRAQVHLIVLIHINKTVSLTQETLEILDNFSRNIITLSRHQYSTGIVT